jgi:hypothetical protein
VEVSKSLDSLNNLTNILLDNYKNNFTELFAAISDNLFKPETIEKMDKITKGLTNNNIKYTQEMILNAFIEDDMCANGVISDLF